MDQKKRLEKARIQLLINNPFFGHLANYFQFKENKTIKGPIATKNKTIYYNPKNTTQYNNEELQTSIAHVIMHTALGHDWRQGNRNKKIWDTSTDQAVNHLLNASNFTLPKQTELKANFKDKSAEEIYAELKKQIKEKNNKNQDKKQPNQKQIKEKNNQYKGASLENKIDSHETWEKTTKKQQKNNQEEWKRRMTEAAKHAEKEGQLPGTIERKVKKTTKPKINWRHQLRRYIIQHARDDYNWMRPNRRLLQYNIYYPSARNEKLEIAVAIDTSGSISQNQLETFLSEVKEILNYTDNYKIILIACDAKIQNYREITSEETTNINKTIQKFAENIKGGGGTKYSPVLEKLKNKQINALIYLTDGKCNEKLKKPKYDVIWAISQQGTTERINFGKKIQINTEN
ncbi:putative metal-dependent peptidase fused to vWFA domain [Methanonatronarchaeum thermophilum]|uniref:Putative metal-dependent peptidase fused to vWFA domain n=1 Tax=Methanonatronarchaeum thermophilum TaxID=1927129 RepID=A0A1Y3GBB8_9EURY|nr:VWA-like domain-containing protein [Methanonatronarchaeum thermophilum]OUJ18709.1 putative metal-dependent peptidase fused to vWFA domain [Methanonatronarchaeum thermophilum]